METQHTPGPWQVNSSNPFQICDADGESRGCAPIARMEGPAPEKRANARRIVACVNACEGIGTAQLEQKVGIVASTLDLLTDIAFANANKRDQLARLCEFNERTADELLAQRDQLLVVAQEALELIEAERRGCDRDIAAKLRAAIGESNQHHLTKQGDTHD